MSPSTARSSIVTVNAVGLPMPAMPVKPARIACEPLIGAMFGGITVAFGAYPIIIESTLPDRIAAENIAFDSLMAALAESAEAWRPTVLSAGAPALHAASAATATTMNLVM